MGLTFVEIIQLHNYFGSATIDSSNQSNPNPQSILLFIKLKLFLKCSTY